MRKAYDPKDSLTRLRPIDDGLKRFSVAPNNSASDSFSFRIVFSGYRLCFAVGDVDVNETKV
jgi:hypothetical protein